ncbi:MAG TPA: inorganic diphosphatase [Candidatus Paceibacterota bacterium]|nr:inorganic diphosphatase [Candidatus Paceibacterota bacterium]
MNLWHEIESGSRDEMHVVIEINKGSKNKYEVDKKTGLIALDRAMHSAQDYPFDYGFVPQTLWEDGDPLDVVVLTTYPLFPGILARVRPVGALNMNDGGDDDIKILAVPTDDPRWDEVTDLGHVNKHTLKEIEHFFQTYKKIQNKEVTTGGYINAEEAKKAFDRSLEIYKEKFGK